MDNVEKQLSLRSEATSLTPVIASTHNAIMSCERQITHTHKSYTQCNRHEVFSVFSSLHKSCYLHHLPRSHNPPSITGITQGKVSLLFPTNVAMQWLLKFLRLLEVLGSRVIKPGDISLRCSKLWERKSFFNTL